MRTLKLVAVSVLVMVLMLALAWTPAFGADAPKPAPVASPQVTTATKPAVVTTDLRWFQQKLYIIAKNDNVQKRMEASADSLRKAPKPEKEKIDDFLLASVLAGQRKTDHIAEYNKAAAKSDIPKKEGYPEKIDGKTDVSPYLVRFAPPKPNPPVVRLNEAAPKAPPAPPQK